MKVIVTDVFTIQGNGNKNERVIQSGNDFWWDCPTAVALIKVQPCKGGFCIPDEDPEYSEIVYLNDLKKNLVEKYEINIEGLGSGQLPENIRLLGGTPEEIRAAQDLEQMAIEAKKLLGYVPSDL